jgi:hypothetical protein
MPSHLVSSKSNDNCKSSICYPIPETEQINNPLEMEVYVRFMRHMRCVANSKEELKILSSIQFVADMLDMSDSHVTKILVDMGLRAPRAALPEEYLDHADAALMRENGQMGCANKSLRDLQNHWLKIGEDRFAAFRKFYPTLAEDVFTRV